MAQGVGDRRGLGWCVTGVLRQVVTITYVNDGAFGLALLFVFFIRSVIFHEVLFPLLVLFDLFVEKLSNFVLLFLDWFGLEDHQGAPNLHASGGTGSHLCWALVEYERTKL